MLEPKEFFSNENHKVGFVGHVFPYYQIPDLLQYPATADVFVEFVSVERSIGEENELAVYYAIHHEEIRQTEDYEFIGHFETIGDEQVFVIESFEEVPFEETGI